jgi:hypothetical protein
VNEIKRTQILFCCARPLNELKRKEGFMNMNKQTIFYSSYEKEIQKVY